eukprot:TRINITY_DN90437_c0_g1_i1.p1 TRINITY_DN90437_c0_g1~~TRINITY_DN90437_c0_g1_i1.p1  ORF type:complete len:2705 (-),score=649.97 TRINITY_DN90437_c0_g1_i1:56-8170(-)
MPPKGKAKAKAKAGGADETATLPVPQPPPTPVLVKFPEAGGTTAQGEPVPSTRCVLLAWARDAGEKYKLQGRAYMPNERDPTARWQDLDNVQAKPIGNRFDVQLVAGLQFAKMEFRLVAKFGQELIEGRFVANWFSAPSEPLAAIVDPPLRPQAAVALRGDYAHPGVRLRFTTANNEEGIAGQEIDGPDPIVKDAGPLAGWPGLAICRCQARWRALKRADMDDIRDKCAADATPSMLPGEGNRINGPVVEVSGAECPFDLASGSWSFVLGDMPPGFVVRVEVRVGTAFRWSAWSEESDDVALVLPAPKPQPLQAVELVKATDSAAQVKWLPFQLAEDMSYCEYRVSVCQLATKDGRPAQASGGGGGEGGDDERWDERSAHVAGIFSSKPDACVEYTVRGLVADMYYIVRVDARYPFVGDRGWSIPAYTSETIYTSFAERPPPLAPIALPADRLEALLKANAKDGRPFSDNLPWLALLVERSLVEDYNVEYKSSRVPSAPAAAAGQSALDGGSGQEPGQGSQEVAAWTSVKKSVAWHLDGLVPLPEGVPNNQAWSAVLVQLAMGKAAEHWALDSIIFRLRHKLPSSVPAHLSSGSTSAPCVVKVAAPAMCCALTRWSSEHKAFGLLVRFYLGTGSGKTGGGRDALGALADVNRMAANPEAFLAQEPNRNIGTRRHLVGHRFATRVQVRLRQVEELVEEDSMVKNSSVRGTVVVEEWQYMPAQPLSPGLARAMTAASDAPDKPGGASEESGDGTAATRADFPAGAGLVWDMGERHELWVWSSNGLVVGTTYKVEVRVGTDTKWSPWGSVQGNVAFRLQPPRPLPNQQRPGREARLQLTAPSPTCIVMHFPPFVTMPGVSDVEYVLTATPKFGEAAELASSEEKNKADKTAEDVRSTAEGAAAVVKRVVGKRMPLRSEEEIIQHLVSKGAIGDIKMHEELIKKTQEESEAEFDAQYTATTGNSLEYDFFGLLPATVYEVSVTASYPGFPGVLCSETLSEKIELQAGASAPLAPIASAVGEAAGVSATSREVVLEIEDRKDYILQFSCRDRLDGWYPSERPTMARKKKSPDDKTSRWWTNGKPLDVVSEWVTVTTRRAHELAAREGMVYVVAELPAFAPGPSNAKQNGELPDVGCFRLRAADRTDSHPCRWVGEATDSMATCIAPLAAAPLPRRWYSDDNWHVKVAFFAHTSKRPPAGQCVADARSSMAADLKLLLDLFDAEEEPGIANEAEEDAPLGNDLPVGYGHRSIHWVQARVRTVGKQQSGVEQPVEELTADEAGEGAAAGAWSELPKVSLEQCALRIPHKLKSFGDEKAGNYYELVLADAKNVLKVGDIYRVQLRLGDSSRWSAWSPSSRRVHYAVPMPRVPNDASALTVKTCSATLARCKWPPFKTPENVSEVMYLLTAEPTWQTESQQGACAATAIHTLPVTADSADGLHEADLPNLLPATEYIFSVSARFPRIGWQRWSARLSTAPMMLDHHAADWVGPPAPAALPCGGPKPFVLSPEGVPFFHPSERAFLLAYPDTNETRDGIPYRLEYKHIGAFSSASVAQKSDLWPIDFRTEWRAPLEIAPVHVSEPEAQVAMAALAASWKAPLSLWRVRLHSAGLDEKSQEVHALAQLQRVQFRLAAECRGDCPATRWYSPPSLPLCSAIAAPARAPGAKLRVGDGSLGLDVSFILDARMSPDVIAPKGSKARRQAARAAWEAQEQQKDEAAGPEQKLSSKSSLPRGFGHSFVTRFQVRARHSPRPPGETPEDAPVTGRRPPPGLPWSAWIENADAGLQVATTEEVSEEECLTKYVADMGLLNDSPLDFGSWYQVSVRISDGVCWSDWSEPSQPVKVYVAPPKPLKPDTDVLVVERGDGGGNVTLRWPALKAHMGLQWIEYALHVREVLQDRSELCTRQTAALLLGKAAGTEGAGEGEAENAHVLRDLRQDVTYVFTVSTRYPHIGPREFDDAMSSVPISLAAPAASLPVPVQLPLPADRLKRTHAARCVLVQWSLAGLPEERKEGRATREEEEEEDADLGGGGARRVSPAALPAPKRYEVQALPEGASEHEWALCTNVARMLVDGVTAFLIKEIPGKSLRHRFRLWEPDTGRLGRTSPLMLSMVEPATKLGVSRVVTESGSQIILRVPLGSPLGSHDFICRYQVRYKAEQLDADWVELPVRMLWHRHNDHLLTPDAPTDAKGALITGLEGRGEEQVADTAEEAGEAAASHPDIRSRAMRCPAIPLASAGASGDVPQQHCLVDVLREEDGLKLTQSYVFSVRLGDLYRLSEWSEPSTTAAKLAIPAPVASPTLAPEDAQIVVTDVTETSLSAEWPQFLPPVDAGIPVHCEVEYLFAVVPMPPRRRLQGRGAIPTEEAKPHSQWLLSSSLPKGTNPADVGRGTPPSVSVSGLVPNTPYELRVSVRYARLGVRSWTEVLAYSAMTKKLDNEARNRLMAEWGGRGVVEPSPAQSTAVFSARSTGMEKLGMTAVPLGAAKQADLAGLDVKLFLKANAKDAKLQGLPATDTPRVLDSPRVLPPLNTSGSRPPSNEERLQDVAPGGKGGGAIGRTPPDKSSEDVLEWTSAMQADTERVVGGLGSYYDLARHGAASPPPGASGSSRPADHTAFWRRDPVDGRPAMPTMPSAGHPAMQLDLMGGRPRQPDEDGAGTAGGGVSSGGGAGRGAGRRPMVASATSSGVAPPRVPPPARPGRPPEERTAYPRRVIYE